ncbi:DEAD/DEAH box helicase family protein [Shewanella avicenniae]|uniref:DEAD/DEAH box helicase family protein n=1 Tax=Shewanella avicenniae TaxID=2814294 RepID=A0ABX7QUV0_9GAMM|nr:DEAD/DEAH box helicase family protein [Shewanella avicenniae]QSX34807.1 DEAD/DEAH box helicase family protein [Shewanella avicenniae]
MSRSSLLTLDHHLLTVGNDDQLLQQLLHAINHADEIEIAVSFIRQSGLELLMPALVEAIERKAATDEPLQLRLLTSDYLGITEPTALRELCALNSDDDDINVRVFECGQQGFHMKSYIFARSHQQQLLEGTAFIGSNNISRPALTTAHEWSLRLDCQANSDSKTQQEFQHIRQQFKAIFNHPNAKPLTDAWISDYINRRQSVELNPVINSLAGEAQLSYLPNAAQIEALQALNISRKAGFLRGLVVMGTGMGKTFLAAFDAKQMNAKRVLFIAHREEILSQALNTFAKVHPKKSSGFYHGKQKDRDRNFLFASVQTLGRKSHLTHFARDAFDYVVIDEFHHASATTYQNVLNYFTPDFLLGLTATPERTDQANILALCHNNLVFERNLVHGIDTKILVPFHYYGIWDSSVDYQSIPWRNGKFDPAALEYQFATHKRAQHIFQHWQQRQQSRTLAFCMSKAHADFMANYFNQQFADSGLRAIAVYSGSAVRRNEALTMLDNGQVNVVFSIDLFNEGTDLPSIDTVMMLRPTESNIVFLQQLGRGLRRHSNKSQLVVIDFIGNHNSFFNKSAVLKLSTATMSSGAIDRPAPELGAGCRINIDPETVDFWHKLTKQLRTTAVEDYQALAAQLGHRPSATEFYIANIDDRLGKVNKQHGSWWELVARMSDDPQLTGQVNQYRDFLLHAVQTTSMNKSFKAILLEAFVELDGFRTPPTIAQLCQQSRLIIDGYPHLKQTDFASKEAMAAINDTNGNKWQSYWRKNPIHFSMQADKKTGVQWFIEKEQHFAANFAVNEQDVEPLTQMTKELVDYQLARYCNVKAIQPLNVSDKVDETEETKSAPLKIDETQSATVTPIRSATPLAAEPLAAEYATDATELPFYPNLKIACGHFKTGRDDDCEWRPVTRHQVDPKKHFLARASGNSMNGGKQPISDGDLLLLEAVSPASAGSITGKTLVIEIQDETGDNQYLLRVVEKDKQGQYWLRANNPDYEPMLATDSMRTLARLKAVLTE